MVSTVVVLDANLHEIFKVTIFHDRILYVIDNTCQGTSYGLLVLRLSCFDDVFNHSTIFLRNLVSHRRDS